MLAIRVAGRFTNSRVKHSNTVISNQRADGALSTNHHAKKFLWQMWAKSFSRLAKAVKGAVKVLSLGQQCVR